MNSAVSTCFRRVAVLAVVPLLVACGSQPPRVDQEGSPPPAAAKPAPQKPPQYTLKRGGGFYQDDGPGDSIPGNLDAVPDAEPRAEPLHRFANNPYSVLGRDYVPMKALQPYRARGVASWYGRKFHGQKTSSGEIYDMFAMTAAHPTLPIPSYVRVTNLANGSAVVVRVNDRGPFLHERLIDLSYAAAWKLGYIGAGSARVEVESVLPGEAPKEAPPADTLLALTKAEAAAPAPAEPPLPAVQELRGTFLQLGAFGSQDNAESFRARLARQLDWLSESIHIHARDGMYRLHLGPYRDAQEAGRVAERIREALALKPFVIQR
ncbi:Endolytic peptidoglycan transglycosylase RlpA [Rhodocyclaceae bacterium]|jgi:rare lipoprotein A|nr:Endolytic peptidoglycan transglycosylase RlpA [Rhodocyclaceae bacterium]